MPRKPLSRPVLIICASLLVAGGLAFAFWPRPLLVDVGEVSRGEMVMTIGEEGWTRVREAYLVSTPVNGRLLRVDAHPGDEVKRDQTLVARMRPVHPAALDIRTREQAMAAVDAARASLRVAEADLQAAAADADLAASDVSRMRKLAKSGTVSGAALDRAESAARAAEAHRLTAQAAISQRQAELHQAQAQLIGFEDRGLVAALEERLGQEIPIFAPVDGVILRVINEDETTLLAGSPILEIGNIAEDLEVVTELISSDAVQVTPGDEVIIENWGGPKPLKGKVAQIEPFGQTKTSALGVEEQRVKVVVEIDSSPEERKGLGHGFGVDLRIVIWKDSNALTAPSSAVFRQGGGWAVYRLVEGRALLTPVEIGKDNGVEVEVLGGLEPGAMVVKYPPATLEDGGRVVQR